MYWGVSFVIIRRMPEQNKSLGRKIVEFLQREPDQIRPSPIQDELGTFNELFKTCFDLGISVQRSRTGEIDITRPIDDKDVQHIKASPIYSHKYRFPSVLLQVRRLNRNPQKRNYGNKAECLTVVMPLNRGDSRAEVYSDEEQYRDITAVTSVLDTSRLALDLLFALSSFPNNQKGMYGQMVYDSMYPKESLVKKLKEGSVMNLDVVSNMEEAKMMGVDASQWAILVYNLLHREVTECVLYPHAQLYASEKSEERAIALK